MAVTILERPKGYILSPDVTASIIDAPGFPGHPLVELGVVHGLVNGDIVYIASNVEEYNGFKYVEVADTFRFLLKDITGATYLTYYQDSPVVYNYTLLTHGWSAVHLPITYKLSTDLYPTNSVDTVRNINSVQNANGYTVLQLSGSLGSVHTYDFIEITLPSDTELSGIYQIVEFISPTVILINLLYDSANNFTSATAQKVYNNYNIVVRVYAGLNASHTWTAQKPYELIATLELTPEDDNTIFFSINEYLKKHIETRNNLVLGTLPNNLDFWTMFYIEVAESYDDSDGYTFGTFTSSFTSDQSNFEGYAVNADLEFKNIHSGYLSEYLMTSSVGKFLTLFTIPVLFSCGDDTPDCYSDISFINPYDDVQLIFRQQYYLNGNAGAVEDINLGTPDAGVIRASLSEADCDYDRVDVTVLTNTEDFTGSDIIFIPGSQTKFYDIFIAAGQDVTTVFKYSTDLTIISGVTAGDVISYSIHYVHSDGTLTLVNTDNRTTVGSTTQTNVSFPTPSKNVVQVRSILTITDIAPTGLDASASVVLNLLSDLESTISETKQFKIDCGCAQQEIRLTWLNNLGGFDYWAFTAKKEHIVEIREVMETKKNIFPNWPKSYGADADTIRKQTSRVSNKAYTVRSQYLTQDEADAISYIKSSVLVQIINSRTDRRTVLVDSDSFVKYQDRDKTYTVSFNISFTDDIPSQKV